MSLINIDSTIHDPANDQDMLTARKAAQLLGVKVETLYAYVSRGLIRRVRFAKGRRVGYVRSDVQRLKARSMARAGHGAVASGALRWGEPVLDSAITRIDLDKGPVYRGHAAVDLTSSSFEEVADLLWQAPHRAWSPPARKGAAPPKNANLLARFAFSILTLGIQDPAKRGASRDAEIERARGIIRCLAGAKRGESVARAFLRTVRAKRQNAKAVKAVDRALVLLADHELNASSFAARVAASAGCDLYACMSAGIATLSGPLHAGECDRVEALVRDVGSPSRARSHVLARTQRGDLLPGFGHPLYPNGDPRSPPLLRVARSIAKHRTLEAIVRAVKTALDLEPTVDCGLVAIAHAIGAPSETATALFALARCAGWVAHIMEQRDAGFLLRPRARYVGA